MVVKKIYVMNKIILRVKLKTETSATIELIYVDSRLMAKTGSAFICYYNKLERFMIYSTNNDGLNYTETALKLPSVNKYKPCQKIEIEFNTETQLKKWLLGLYYTLHRLEENLMELKFCDDRGSNKVILDKNFWIL